jgi:hypothetical protein
MKDPKEEAIRMAAKFSNLAHADWDEYYGYDYDQRICNSKQCALIAVQNTIDALNEFVELYAGPIFMKIQYFTQVKEEINKL